MSNRFLVGVFSTVAGSLVVRFFNEHVVHAFIRSSALLLESGRL